MRAAAIDEVDIRPCDGERFAAAASRCRQEKQEYRKLTWARRVDKPDHLIRVDGAGLARLDWREFDAGHRIRVQKLQLDCFL
jgi:hypothetical protein